MKKARKSGWSVSSFLVSEGLRSFNYAKIIQWQFKEWRLKRLGQPFNLVEGGGGGGEAEQKRKGNSSLTFSLSSPNPFRRLPRRLQKCFLAVLENSMTCHELGFLYTCLFVFWGRVGGEKWGSSQNNCQRSLIGEACSVFDKLKNMKCRWANYYVLN